MRSSGNWRKGSNPFLSAKQNLIEYESIWFRFFFCKNAVFISVFRFFACRRFILFVVRMGVFVSLIPYHSFVQTEKSIDKTLFIWYYIFVRKEGLVSSKQLSNVIRLCFPLQAGDISGKSYNNCFDKMRPIVKSSLSCQSWILFVGEVFFVSFG